MIPLSQPTVDAVNATADLILIRLITHHNIPAEFHRDIGRTIESVRQDMLEQRRAA